MKRLRKRRTAEAELDITPFMNLMIVLVPILLLGMVFSRITVVDIVLPQATSGGDTTLDEQQLELIIRDNSLRLDFPRGVVLKNIPLTSNGDYDYALLSLVLQEVKRQLREKGLSKTAITILAEPQVDYQTIVHLMDTVRSFKALVAASVVDAELFPQISFGDAPPHSPGGAG